MIYKNHFCKRIMRNIVQSGANEAPINISNLKYPIKFFFLFKYQCFANCDRYPEVSKICTK